MSLPKAERIAFLNVKRIQNAFDMFDAAQIKSCSDPTAPIPTDSQKIYRGKIIFSVNMVSDHFLPLR